ncbi:SCO family protein [Owenweeksia hongkongensis]|uniref:SCO family protein n=1 Tax=Owenweeksia hongkongensis TaxID=253245 RepID=UPI003A905427
MKKYNSVNKLSIYIFALVLFGCGQKEKKAITEIVLPYYNEATFTPHWLAKDKDELNDFHQIPEFSLVNQNGEIITKKTLRGKIYVTNFFFTSCPGICPKMTTNMGLIQEAFLHDDDVLLLSHSVTPDFDSVPILKEYAQKKNVESGKWHLLTGDRDQIYSLGRNSYFVEEDLGLEKDNDDFLHTENVILVDQNGYIRGIYNGLNQASMTQLIEDIQTLKSNL